MNQKLLPKIYVQSSQKCYGYPEKTQASQPALCYKPKTWVNTIYAEIKQNLYSNLTGMQFQSKMTYLPICRLELVLKLVLDHNCLDWKL